jgi:hypothetical protein
LGHASHVVTQELEPATRTHTQQLAHLGSIDPVTRFRDRFDDVAARLEESFDRLQSRVLPARLDAGDRWLRDARTAGKVTLGQPPRPAGGLEK